MQGFHAWKKIGRSVKKGEKGIGIIAPMIGRKKDDGRNFDDSQDKTVFGFKVVHVFDVSQTEGDEMPEFAQVSGDPGENILAVESLIHSWGVDELPLDWTDIHEVRSFEEATQEVDFDDHSRSTLDWQTHVATCPECQANDG